MKLVCGDGDGGEVVMVYVGVEEKWRGYLDGGEREVEGGRSWEGWCIDGFGGE